MFGNGKMLRTLVSVLLLAAMMCPAVSVAESADDGVMREGISSLELTRLMGNGTNLGNTMEACDARKFGLGGNTGKAPTEYEVGWGQPVTTQEMLNGMKAYGFDTIRIPVAWMTNASHLNEGDYTLDEPYLARVKEIVDYARNAGMYVIINDHWDGGWWGMFGSESAETRALAMEAYKGMWKQIAEYFRDYSDYLIFEGANEEIGARFDEDSALYCNDSVKSYLSDDERYALANEVNQAFVDTVRSTGGNNATRFLLIPGYGTNIAQTCDNRFKMPIDTAEDKLLISVHFYDPWSYCGDSDAASATAWGTKRDYENMDKTLARMEKFTKQGIGVVIGEYGALPGGDGILKDNTLNYHTRFLDLCDYYGYTSCLWDCSGFFIRKELKFSDEELGKMYAGRNAESEKDRTEEEVKQAAKARLDAQMADAPDSFRTDVVLAGDDKAVAWIMWSDGSWALSYSVGDEYQPDTISPGVVATDAVIDGEGTYKVALDFTGSDKGFSSSTAFSALGIANGEILYPGWVIDITECKINGEVYRFKGRPYTTSDNGICTRANLFNEWVTKVPRESARVRFGDLTGVTPTPLDRNAECMAEIKTIELTFWYGPRK
ncbi:MAG: glycoside hydrolase family 5 protein [Clostridia bacterium]|nr:glycoside hydrolase family 5 protein [Clostridia bacterium]